jgi:hypothetical protein
VGDESTEGDSKVGYHFQNGLIYKLGNIYVLKGELMKLIRQAHISKVARHLGVGNIVSNLQRYVYWPKMK